MLLALGGAILAGGLFLVWLILWLSPPGSARLVLVGAGYEDNLHLDPNAPGVHPLVRLAELARQASPLSSLFTRSGRLRLAHEPLTYRKGDDWARGLDEVAEPTVIVYLALHGGADAKGAYLLPQDATADPDDRLRLEAVLDRLAQLPARKNKVLILDATTVRSAESLGMLHNDFARALADLDGRITEIPNLIVISSADVDQRSLPARDGRMSLFGRHLVRGLSFDADRGEDGRLDAWELFEHVCDKVKAGARRQGAEQTPVLLPRAEGKKRARRIALTFRLKFAEEEPPSDPVPEIQAAWQRYHDFKPQVSAALASAPRAWRQWGALLVRYEQLRRAHSPAAEGVLQKAREVEDQLRRAIDPPLKTGLHSLAMPAIGQTMFALPEPCSPLEDLWQAAPRDRVNVKAALEKNRDLFSRSRLRRDLLEGIILRAAENPARNLVKAAELVHLLDDPLRPIRPAEAHFLVMLQRDLPGNTLEDRRASLVRRALRLRLTAERSSLALRPGTFARAERVYPAIRELTNKADRQRQLGQDLLFTTDADELDRAEKYLAEAEKLYARAEASGAAVRAAWNARDRALSELPEHARWLPEDLVKDAQAAADQVRTLESTLEKPNNLATLQDQATSLNRILDRLQGRLDAAGRTCESTQSGWRETASGLLKVPGLSLAERLRLVRKLEKAGKTQGQDEPVSDSPPTRTRDVQGRASRLGRVTLAGLGASWFDRFTGDNRERYADVAHRLDHFRVEEHWWRSLRLAGDQIGDRIRQQFIVADRQDRRARRELNAGALVEAANLTRRLDAGACQDLRDDPASLERRIHLQGLLIWQAERTYHDHWYGEDPRATPYYRTAGLDFLADASRVDPWQRQQVPGLAKFEAILRRTEGLRLVKTETRSLWPGEKALITGGLEWDEDTSLPGYPLVWAEPGKGLTLPRPADASRLVQRVGPGRMPERPAVTVTSPDLDKQESMPPERSTPLSAALIWRGLYRGRVLEERTRVNLLPVASSTRLELAPSARAAVSVRAAAGLQGKHGVAQGALTFVLDCSGSMSTPIRAGSSDTRWTQVTRTLRKVLAQVPRGTSVSIWVFGQAVGVNRTVASAEDTIQRVQAPITWNGGERQINQVMNTIEGLTPWNESPIVTAMLRTKADLVKARGFKNLVVLTDGVDNRFAKDTTNNPDKESIPAVLAARFRGTRINVHVVGFQLNAADSIEASKQFEAVKKLTPSSTFTKVNRLDDLERALSRTMRPALRYQIVGERKIGNRIEKVRTSEVQVSDAGDNDRWMELETGDGPAGYRLDVTTGWDLNQRLQIRPGDLLSLRLYSAGKEPACERIVWGKEPAFRLRPARTMRDWRATLIQNQRFASRAMQMLLAVEQQPDSSEAIIRQTRPRDSWLEVSTSSSNDLALRWGGVHGYPAPCLGIDAEGWPDRATPRVRLWLSPDLAAPGKVLKRQDDFRTLTDLPRSLILHGEEVRLESAGIEQRWVQVRRDKAVREKRWCLVIRGSYPLDRPLWVKPEGLPPIEGEEHRFHAAQGRYMGVFWFANLSTEEEVRDRVDRDLGSVTIVSVPALKKEALTRRYSADFADLPAPGATPDRPASLLVEETEK